MEELEKRLGIKIEAVRDMMLDRFSGVDQKLTAIEQLLKKIIELQSQTGNPQEPRWNLTVKNTGEGETESSKNQDKGKKVAVGGGDGAPSDGYGPNKPLRAQFSLDGDDQETEYQLQGPPGGLDYDDGGGHGPSYESGPKKPLRAQISSDGVGQDTDCQTQGPLGGRHGPPWEAGGSCRWVGLYTHHYSTYNSPKSGYSFGTDFCGPAWVGLEETNFSKKNGPSFGSNKCTFKGQFGKNFVVGCPETQRDTCPEEFGSKAVNIDVTEKGLNNSSEKGVKTGQDGIFMEGGNKPQAQVVTEGRSKNRRRKRKVNKADVTKTNISWTRSTGEKVVKMGRDDKVADNTNAGGEYKKDERTDVILDDSLKPDPCGKAIQNETNCKLGSVESDKGLDCSKLVEAKTDSQHVSGAAHCSKLVEAKTDSQHVSGAAPWGAEGNNKPPAQVVSELSNEKGKEEGQKPGSWGLKEEGCSSKRKHPDSPVEGPNEGPMSNGPFTAAKQRLDAFTTEEQGICSEIEPIMQSIRGILHQKGYNDGDPLSADDQTYIIENVFNYHPEKAQKIGAGLDYIMVSKHMIFQGSRCFYVVSTDGRKEDFSYHKCLKNFLRGKYPNKLDEFIPKL